LSAGNLEPKGKKDENGLKSTDWGDDGEGRGKNGGTTKRQREVRRMIDAGGEGRGSKRTASLKARTSIILLKQNANLKIAPRRRSGGRGAPPTAWSEETGGE